jgi:hypothetical protein
LDAKSRKRCGRRLETTAASAGVAMRMFTTPIVLGTFGTFTP